MEKLMIGAAKVDVTPKEELLPCYTSMGHLLTAIHDPIYVRAIALVSGQSRMMFLELPVDYSYYTEEIKERAVYHGFRPDHVIISGTGTHNYPVVPKKGHPPVRERDKATAESYLPFVKERCLEAMDRAAANMQRAKYGHGIGRCYTNCERCKTLPDGYGIEAPVLGAKIERTMQVLKFTDMEDRPLAEILHYDLSGAPLFLGEARSGEGIMVTDELWGMCLNYVDNRLGNASVAINIGGGQGNTCVNLPSVKYDFQGMPVEIEYHNGVLYDMVETRAQETAFAALDILEHTCCDRDFCRIRMATGSMSLPGQEVFKGPRGALNAALAHMHGQFPGPEHPRFKNIIARNGGEVPLFPGEEYPPKLVIPKPVKEEIQVPVNMFLMEDLAMFIPSGSYYTGTEKRCKEEPRSLKLMFLGGRLLENPGQGQEPGPVYDDEHKEDLGYQRMHSHVYPGNTNEIVVQAMEKLFDQLGVKEKQGDVEFYYE